MTIVVVCDVLGEENNGTTIAAMNLVRMLIAKGHNVRVVCPDEFRRGQPGFYIVPRLNVGPFNGYVEKNGVAIAKVDRETLRQALDGADAVHIITPFFLSRAALKMAKEMNIPVTAGFHCQAENFSNHIFLMNSHGFNNKVYKYFYKHFYKDVDCVHYPSQFIRETFETECGHKPNGRVISNGVNTRFQKRETKKPVAMQDRFVILFTGRYSREKSHEVLIKAVSLSRYSDKIQLIFAGQGPLENKLRKLSQKLLKIQPVFKFFGRDEMVDVINYADLYVHPAEVEIEAIACLEAIACGTVPVIADSKRSATRFFALDENNLFRSNDPGDLADKIDYWLEDAERREKRSIEYSGYSKKFAQDYCMNEMERMICETVESKKVAG